MLTHRVLPRAEWDRLAGTPLDVALPNTTTVVVVEDELGEIVASWSAMIVLHLHGLNVTERHRKRPSVFRHLIMAMCDAVKAYHASGAFTTAESEEVRTMLQSYGAERVVGDGYVVRLKETRCQP